jgi:di/tripeptidase
MDVVGDNSPVNIRVSQDGKYIETDKKRPLGADDKVGVSAAIYLAMYLSNHPEIKHGGLELIFTRDEEQNMTGIHNVDFADVESEYVLVLDADRLGQIQIAGASYTNGTLIVNALKGGHSGIDIWDKSRLNAVKLIAQLVNEIPQGEYKSDEFGSVTSINIGCIVGGGVEPTIQKIVQKSQEQDSYIEYVANNCLTNIINTKAMAKYSIRSSEPENENQLIEDIKNIVEKFNKEYEGLANAEFVAKTKMKAFEKSDDDTVPNVCTKACENIGIKGEVSSFHAGAETHIYANEYNKYQQKFKPCLLGLADIYNMHSSNEMVDINSFLKGYEFLKETFLVFNA